MNNVFLLECSILENRVIIIYKAETKYETCENINNRNRHRKIIWFGPPFSQSVKTNIGKIFLKLVRKHFPRHHKLHKIFNPNTLKLSYCCMKNISNIIKQHNATVLAISTANVFATVETKIPTPLMGVA